MSSYAELGPLTPIIDAALAEDLGSGDVTARLTVPADVQGAARIMAKQAFVFCGGAIVEQVFARVDASVRVELVAGEAERVERGQLLVRIAGSARALLAGERVALNLLGRACAVATLTRAYVDAAGPHLRVVDTRKTMPGLRAIDRYAVRCGGGHNHRNDLGAGVLIKENHIRAAGSVGQAVRAAKQHAPHTLRIECEVTNHAELREAMAAGADAVLLDNMSDDELREAVAIADGKLILEVSGGVTLERLPRLASIGVHLASVGALTHSAPSVDMSMLFDV